MGHNNEIYFLQSNLYIILRENILPKRMCFYYNAYVKGTTWKKTQIISFQSQIIYFM